MKALFALRSIVEKADWAIDLMQDIYATCRAAMRRGNPELESRVSGLSAALVLLTQRSNGGGT